MRVLTATALLLAVSQATTSQPCAQFSPNPVPTSHLPAYFPRQKSNPKILPDIEDIRQATSQYALIIDSRSFASLSSIFTPDAVANYSAPLGVPTGLPAITSSLSTALAQFQGTQHLLGTQRVRICDERTAISVTYFQATHFLSQNATIGATGVSDDSAVLYAYAQYKDSWVKREGVWKVRWRNVVYMGPLVTDTN